MNTGNDVKVFQVSRLKCPNAHYLDYSAAICVSCSNGCIKCLNSAICILC